MQPLEVPATWTRILSVAAGAPAATGAPGPGTEVSFAKAASPERGPWLGLIDLLGLQREDRQAIRGWLARRARPLLMVRHLLLAEPLEDDVFVELSAETLATLPPGFRERPQPILILAPAPQASLQRKQKYVDALSRLRIPLTSAGSDLWAVRDYDSALLAAVAALSQPAARAAFRGALDQSQARLFEEQLPLAEAALLDDLAGVRDDEGPLGLDAASLRSLSPQTHPLAAYGAVERAQNQRRPLPERTFFSGRTIEARRTGRGFPPQQGPCPPDFAARAEPLALLPDELQRLYEAANLLDRA